MSKVNRTQIRKNINDYGDLRNVQFFAGYGQAIASCFDGNMTQAWSVREGVDWITTIECFDAGFAFANATSERTFQPGTPQTAIINSLIQDLGNSGVTLGAIGNFPGTTTRGTAYTGNTIDLLKQITNGRFYIDNGKAYALSDNECTNVPVLLINAATGLLNTPVRQQTIITFSMLFEPRLTVGQQVNLQSSTTDDQNVNGIYKVVSIKHRGMISDAVCGDAITEVGLLQPLGSQGLVQVSAA